MFFFFSSCGGSISTNNLNEENDSGNNETENDNYSMSETDTESNDIYVPEQDDSDWIFESEPGTEHLNIFFRSKPHGITEWNREYRYPIKCKSPNSQNIEISVTENDTCGGKLEGYVYIFKPEEKKFPSARCSISVNCSDDTNSVTQTTLLIIPNSYEFKSTPEQEKIPVKKIVWSDEVATIFLNNGVLFRSDHIFSIITVINRGISEYFSSKEALYYISGNNIFSIKGEDDPQIILSDTKIQEKCADCSISSLIMVNDEKKILLSLKEENSQTWYFNPEEDEFVPVDRTQIYSAWGTPEEHIFLNKGKLFLFDYIKKTFSEICSGFSPFLDDPHSFFGSKFYYKTMDCGGGETHSLNIGTCETEYVGRVDIKSHPRKGFFFASETYASKPWITLFSKEGTKTISDVIESNYIHFYVENLESNDGKNAFLPFSYNRSEEKYKCFAILNFETGEVTLSDKECSNGNVMDFAGFSGENAVYNSYGDEFESKLILVDENGKVDEVAANNTRALSFQRFKFQGSHNEKDILSFEANNSIPHVFITDGKPRHLLYLGQNHGRIVSLIRDQLIVTHIDKHNNLGMQYISFYNIKNGKRTGIASSGLWRSYNGTLFEGIHDYQFEFGGMTFFGVGGYYGKYSIWSVNGNPLCSVDHAVFLVHSHTNRYRETIYSSKYLKDYLSVSIDNGIYFNASHFIEPTCRKAIPTGKEGESLGFIGKKHIGYTKKEYITSIFSQDRENTEWIYFPENMFFFLEIIGDSIVAIDTPLKGEKGGNIYILSDFESEPDPVIIEFFPLDEFRDVEKIVNKGDFAIFSAINNSTGKSIIKLLSLYDGVSVRKLFSVEGYDFKGLTIIDGNFIFYQDSKLKSVNLKNESSEVVTLYQKTGEYSYLGNSYSKKAVISVSDKSELLIVTDGKDVVSLDTGGNTPTVWKEWILTKYGIVQENEFGELEEIIIEKPFSLNLSRSRTKNNLYYHSKSGIYVYHPPKPVYNRDK